MKIHKQIKTYIKPKVEIDEGILPVVNWLNSFDSVITNFSCEGTWHKNGNPNKSDAYVVFKCEDMQDLARITLANCSVNYNKFANITVETYQGQLRFTWRIEYKPNLDAFIEKLKHI